jgi:hypothetical protein
MSAIALAVLSRPRARKPFALPIRFTLSKKWRKRLRRAKNITVKVGIAVVGAALSTVTGGASAVLAAAALAALAARDHAKAAKAAAEARAKVAAGMEANAALLQSVAENQVDLTKVISGILDGSHPPQSQDPGTQHIIGSALGFGPMPGGAPPVLETFGVALGLGGIVLLAGGPLLLAGAAAVAAGVVDRAGFLGKFFNAVRGAK